MTVVVIGGGAAGLMAAVAAKRAGVNDVTVVRKAGGATVLSSGAVDVADQEHELTPGSDRDPLAHGKPLQEAVEWTAARFPRHPYARVGEEGRKRLDESLALLAELASDVRLVRRPDGKNHIVATQLGTVKRTAMVPTASLLDLGSLEGGSAVVGLVDVEDLGGFDAVSAQQMLRWIEEMSSKRVAFGTLSVPRLLSGDHADNPSSLAARYQASGDELAPAFAAAVKRAVEAQLPSCTHLLLPPVLALSSSPCWQKALQATLPQVCRELLALPPSAPGQRFMQALLDGAEREGVEVLQGQVLSAQLDDDQLHSLTLRAQGKDRQLNAEAVVLASGRFLAGGLVRDRSACEPIFSLPVITDGQQIDDQFIGQFTEERPEGSHLIFRAGIAFDDALRPLKARHTVVATNLFAAGSILEGYDPARDGTGLGVAALTGFLAGRAAAQSAGRGMSSVD